MNHNAMKYKINPAREYPTTVREWQHDAWNAMIAEFERNGDAGVPDTLLLGITLKEGKASKTGNLDFLRHIVQKGWIIPA